jgi:hypothetical protein
MNRLLCVIGILLCSRRVESQIVVIPWPPADTLAPAAITNLAITAATQTTVTLSWTAPGDDGTVGTATTYDMRTATAGPITTQAAFDAATPSTGAPSPEPAGSAQSVTLTGLTPSTTYWFCLITADEIPNWSGLSNSPTATTAPAADTTSPAAITDLTVTGKAATTVMLRWTAPGDDGMVGTAAAYDVRVSTSGAITSPAAFLRATPVTNVPVPAPGGTPQNVTVTGLRPGTTYFLAMRSRDEAFNWSEPSNSALATTDSAGPPRAPKGREKRGRCVAGQHGRPSVGWLVALALIGAVIAAK